MKILSLCIRASTVEMNLVTTTDALYAAIAAGLQTLTAQNAQGWFAHCGYKGLLN